MYPSAVSHYQCCDWFEWFPGGNFDLWDCPKSWKTHNSGYRHADEDLSGDWPMYNHMWELAAQMGTTTSALWHTCTNLVRWTRGEFGYPINSQFGRKQISWLCAFPGCHVSKLNHSWTASQWKMCPVYDNVSGWKRWLDTKLKSILTIKPGLHPHKFLLSV